MPVYPENNVFSSFCLDLPQKIPDKSGMPNQINLVSQVIQQSMYG